MERRVYPIMTVAVDSGVLYSAMLIAGITLLLRIAPDAFRTNAMVRVFTLICFVTFCNLMPIFTARPNHLTDISDAYSTNIYCQLPH